jgi:hypothetical protein
MTVNVNVVFMLGLGQLNSRLYRGNSVIATGSVSASGTITYNGAISTDLIEIDGMCSGNATVTISVPTTNPTPQNYPAGYIFDNFIIN